MSYHLLFLQFVLLLNVQSFLRNSAKAPKNVNLLTSVLKVTQIQSCSLLFVTKNEIGSHFEEKLQFFHLLRKIKLTNIFVVNLNQYSFPERYFENFERNKISGKQHKFQKHCQLVITFTDVLNSNFSEYFLSALTSNSKPLSEKDKDFYIFISSFHQFSNTGSQNEILMLPLSLEIKYKLFLPFESLSRATSSGLSICFYCNNGNAQIVSVAPPGGDYLSEDKMFPDYSKNLHGHVLRVSAYTMYPAGYEIHKINGKYQTKRGYHGDALHQVLIKLNASYSAAPSTGSGKISPGGSGILMENGTWVGCIGDVLYAKADVALNMGMSTQRFALKDIEFSNFISTEHVNFLAAKPKYIFTWKIIYWTFGNSLWAAIASVFFFATATEFLLEKHELKTGNRGRNAAHRSVTTITFSLLASLINQSVQSPKMISGKINFAFWLCFSLIIGVAYVSKLTVLIARPALEDVPRSFLELSLHSDFRLGAPPAFHIGLGKAVFKLSSNRHMKGIFRRMEYESDYEFCTTRALGSKFACIMWDFNLQYIVKRNFSRSDGKHPFSIASDATLFIPVRWISRRGALYLAHFNRILESSRESGLAAHWMSVDWTTQRQLKYSVPTLLPNQNVNLNNQKPTANDMIFQSDENGIRPFSIENIQGAIYLLAIGTLIAFFTFTFETLQTFQIRFIKVILNYCHRKM